MSKSSNVVQDYFDTMPYLQLLFPKIMHNGIDVTGSLYIVRQAAWVFWKLDKYSKANPSKDIHLVVEDPTDNKYIVNPDINYEVTTEDIVLLCVMLIQATKNFNNVNYTNYIGILEYCRDHYKVSKNLINGIIKMISIDMADFKDIISFNFIQEIFKICKSASRMKGPKRDKLLYERLYSLFEYYNIKYKIFKEDSNELANIKNEYFTSSINYGENNIIFLEWFINKIIVKNVKDTKIINMLINVCKDINSIGDDIFIELAKTEINDSLLTNITTNSPVGTTHQVELIELLNNAVLIGVTTIGNSLKLTQHDSFYRSFEPLQDEKLSFSHDDSGSIILRDAKGEKINISLEIAKQTDDLCNVFGGDKNSFSNDCSNLYAYCFNNNPSEFKKEFKDLTSIPSDLIIWDNLSISKDKQKYIAYKILTTLGINGENYSLGIRWIKNGSPYLSDDDICSKAGIVSDMLKANKLIYIKALMTGLNNIRIMNTQNRKFGVYEYTPINMEKTKIHSFNLMLGMPGIPLQFGAGAKGKLPILYGGKITDNILNIINPIYKLIENIENKGITINIKKIKMIHDSLNLIKGQAQILENAEEEIAIYNSLLQKSPNKPPLINEADFQAELDKVQQKKEENIKKLEKNIEKVGKIQDSLIRFIP